jgi:hypothetical protein
MMKLAHLFLLTGLVATQTNALAADLTVALGGFGVGKPGIGIG